MLFPDLWNAGNGRRRAPYLDVLAEDTRKAWLVVRTMLKVFAWCRHTGQSRTLHGDDPERWKSAARDALFRARIQPPFPLP